MSIIRLQALTLDRKFVISHWLPCGADGQVDGRTGGRAYGHVTTRIYRMDGLPNVSGMGLCSRARGATPLVLPITI